MIEHEWLFPSTRGQCESALPIIGFALTSAIERHAVHVRRAVSEIEKGLPSGIAAIYCEMFGPRMGSKEVRDEEFALRAAWALASIWLLGRLSRAVNRESSFVDAERWFTANSQSTLCGNLRCDTIGSAHRHLARLHIGEALGELLPYVLDSHGPGSRASVMRDPRTHSAREKKRKLGVFYTPTDVAKYMASELLNNHGGSDPACLTCIDPACGSGVFLRSLLREVEVRTERFDRFEYATTRLYGFDVSTLAVESACFVLLAECLDQVLAAGLSPLQGWHLLRLNFAVIDAVTVRRQSGKSVGADLRSRSRTLLLSGKMPEKSSDQIELRSSPTLFSTEWGQSLGDMFPEVANGFDLLLGNPPYAAVGEREDHAAIEENYSCLVGGGSRGSDLYPLFVEMMWRLTRVEQSAASLVVPLSIAYQTRPQFVALRKEMGRIPGRWRFGFFDREPHALFGEDVKTRNAIVFHRRGGLSNAATVLETGPLRKWTSRSRAAMFANIRFTPLQRLEITLGIPKVDGESQASALNLLERRSDRISDLWLHSGRASAAVAFLPSEQSTVFVASTAYNFINVFRPHQQPRSSRLPLTENPLLAIECADERVARAIFAILSSRIIFWWWHTHGDGFHVTKTFIEGIPLGSQLSSETVYRLSDAGEQLWRAVQPFRIISLNGGRESVAYRPILCEFERDEIDRIIIAATGLDPTFADEVRRFVWSTVVVDERDERRRKLHE